MITQTLNKIRCDGCGVEHIFDATDLLKALKQAKWKYVETLNPCLSSSKHYCPNCKKKAKRK